MNEFVFLWIVYFKVRLIGEFIYFVIGIIFEVCFGGGESWWLVGWDDEFVFDEVRLFC